MKKKIITILVFLAILLIFSNKSVVVKASQEESSSTSQNLESAIDELINSIDLKGFEEYLKSIPEAITGGGDVKSQIVNMLKGEAEITFNSVGEYLLSLLFSGIKEKLPIFVSIFALLVICAVINSIKSNKLGSGVYEIVHFACFSVIICIVLAIAYSLVLQTKDAITKTGKAVQTVFPIMLTLMTVTGNSTSVAVYNPAMLFVSDFVVIIVNKVIFPVILSMLAITVISSICKTVKLNGLVGFSSGALKWIIGLVATVFSLFLTVRGLNSSIYDGISLRALKYTVNSSVPLVGGILRDGLDLILASGVLVKNALGAVAIIIIFGIVIQPILEIACVNLALKLVNAVLEPLSDTRTSSFINSVGSIINFLIASIVLVSLMYLIIILLAICSSQMIF